MVLGKPTIEEWQRRYRYAEKMQGTWSTEAHLMEQLYEMEWALDGVPNNIPITIPSTARAVIDESTDHSDFDPHWLRIKTPTYGLAEDAESNASRLRSWLLGWFIYNAEVLNDVSPFRDWTKNAYLFGKAVYKVVADHEQWPSINLPEGMTNEEARVFRDEVERNREFIIPIVMRSVDPRAIKEDLSAGQKQWAIEEYEYDAAEVMSMYHNWIPSLYKDRSEVPLDTRIKIWDCYQIGKENGVDGVWHQVLVNESDDMGNVAVTPAAGPGKNDPVWLPNEPFPYIVKFAGFGRQSSGQYHHKARGILWGAQYLLKAEARRMTQLDAIVSAMAWPTLFVTGPRNRFEVVYGPNKVNYVPIGVTVTTVAPPIPTGPIEAALGMIQSGIERATFGSVIRGDKPANTTSAAQLAILSGQARLRFGSIKQAHQAALREAAVKASIIHKHVIKAPLRIWQTEDTDSTEETSFTLKPSEQPSNLNVYVEIMTDPAEQREREVNMAMQLFMNGGIDLEEFRERIGISDTAAMRRRRIRDGALERIAPLLGEVYLMESGYDLESLTIEKAMRDMLILRRQQEMAQQIMGGGGPSGGGGTGTPPNGMNPNTPLGGRPAAPPSEESALGGANAQMNQRGMSQENG